jgi:hypothetical protein
MGGGLERGLKISEEKRKVLYENFSRFYEQIPYIHEY